MNKSRKKWTEEALRAEARKYIHKKDFQKFSGCAYVIAHKRKLLEKCCEHMLPLKNPNGTWGKENCIKEAKKYNYKKEWLSNSSASYSAAAKNGWMEEASVHMVRPISHSKKWTKDTITEEALKYETKKEWSKNSSSSYNAALKGEYLQEMASHMKKPPIHNKKWVKEISI